MKSEQWNIGHRAKKNKTQEGVDGMGKKNVSYRSSLNPHPGQYRCCKYKCCKYRCCQYRCCKCRCCKHGTDAVSTGAVSTVRML